MRTTTVLTVAGLCLLANNARAAVFSVIDGVGVDVTDAGNFTAAKAAMLRAAGVSVVRTDFASHAIDKGEQPWDYSQYDQFFTVCKDAGLRIWVILQYGGLYCHSSIKGDMTFYPTEHAAVDWGPCVSNCYDTPEFRSRFDNYVSETVKHFTQKAIAESYDPHFIWELWNEPNLSGFWPQRPPKTVDGKTPVVGDYLAQSASRYAGYKPTEYYNCDQIKLEAVATDDDSERFRTASSQYRNLALGAGVSDDGALKTIRDAASQSWNGKAPFPSTIVGPGVSAPLESDYSTTYLSSGLGRTNLTLLEQLSVSPYIDGISAHFYRLTNPETVVNGVGADSSKPIADDNRPINETSFYGDAALGTGLRGRMGHIPIYSGEWGYTEAWPGITRQVQADNLQRMMLTNFSQGIPVSIWFEDQDTYDVFAGFNWGLFENYCGSDPSFCKNLCKNTPGACIQESCSGTPATCSPSCTADGSPFCAGHPDECYQGKCYPYHLRRNELNWGKPKPAFYAMKTLTSNLSDSQFYVRYRADPGDPYAYVGADNYLMLFRSQTNGREILAAWTATTPESPIPVSPMVSGDPYWGSFWMTNTPMYLGQPLTWNGGDWSANTWSYATLPDSRTAWPNNYDTDHDNYQAVFDQRAQNTPIIVDRDYYVGGFQFGAPNVVLYGGGHLRFTPGGGNLYVADGNFDTIAVPLTDAYDRGTEPLAYTNTPETFVLRKSGGGQVSLGGDNTFHGTVLVAQGSLSLGHDHALGDPHNPLTLVGGAIDFWGGRTVETGPLAVNAAGPALGTLGNWGAASTKSVYMFPSGTIAKDVTLTVGGGGSLELAGPISGAGGLTKIDSGTLILSNAGNTYTGLTTVNAGTLTGTGGIGGDVYVTGGHLSPGGNRSDFKSTTVGGNVTFGSGGSLDIDLDAIPGSSDTLVMTGATSNLTLNGTLNLYAVKTLQLNASYTIISGPAGIGVYGAFTKIVGPPNRTYRIVVRLANGRRNVVLVVSPNPKPPAA